MSELYWLTDAQMDRLRPFFPKSRGKPRVDDRRVLSGTEEGQQTVRGTFCPTTLHPTQWVDVEACSGGLRSAKDALQSLEAVEPDGCVRHDHIRAGGQVAGDRDRDDRRDPREGAPDRVEPCSSKGGAWTADRADCEDQETIRGIVSMSTGGLNSKLHVVADAKGRPIRMFLSAGQTSD